MEEKHQPEISDPFCVAIDAFHYWDTGFIPGPEHYPGALVSEIMQIVSILQKHRTTYTAGGVADELARKFSKAEYLKSLSNKTGEK